MAFPGHETNDTEVWAGSSHTQTRLSVRPVQDHVPSAKVGADCRRDKGQRTPSSADNSRAPSRAAAAEDPRGIISRQGSQNLRKSLAIPGVAKSAVTVRSWRSHGHAPWTTPEVRDILMAATRVARPMPRW